MVASAVEEEHENDYEMDDDIKDETQLPAN